MSTRLAIIPIQDVLRSIEEVKTSKKTSEQKYLGNDFVVTSSKPEDLNLASLFFSTIFHLSSDFSSEEKKKRNTEVILGLREIFKSDYPEDDVIFDLVILTPHAAKIDGPLQKTIWLQQIRDFIIFEKFYLRAVSIWAKLELALEKILETKPEGVRLKKVDDQYSYYFDSPVYTTRLVAFLGKLFKKKFQTSKSDHDSIETHSNDFLNNRDLIHYFCYDSDPALKSFARKSYWIATFEEILTNYNEAKHHAIHWRPIISIFRHILTDPRTLKSLKKIAPDYFELEKILSSDEERSFSTHFELKPLGEDKLHEIIELYENYLKKTEKNQRIYDLLSKLTTQVKLNKLRDELFKVELEQLETQNKINTFPVFTVGKGLKGIDDLTEVLTFPFLDSPEFEEYGRKLLLSGKFKKKEKPRTEKPRSEKPDDLEALASKSTKEEVSTSFSSAEEPSDSISTNEIPLDKLENFILEKSQPFNDAWITSRIRSKKPEINYAERVENWFLNPHIPLETPKYADLSEELKEHAVFIHTFPSIIDRFVGTQYSTFMPWVNPSKKGPKGPTNWLFALPCEAEKGGLTHRGFLVYVVDSVTEKCFHRCFDIESEKYPLGTAMMHGWDQIRENFSWSEVDFPSIEVADARRSSRSSEGKARGGGRRDYRVEFEEITEIVTITISDGTKYRLFPIL